MLTDFLSYRMALESQNSAHDLIHNVGKPLFLGLSQHCNLLENQNPETLRFLRSLEAHKVYRLAGESNPIKYSAVAAGSKKKFS